MRLRAPLTFLVLGLSLLPATSQAAGLSWKLSFSEDFNGSQIDSSSWSVYGKGGPKGPHCWYDKNITVGGRLATLEVLPSSKCDGYSAAGMCAYPVATQTHGKFEVRMKAT